MMTRENILLFKNMNMTRYTSIMRKVVLTTITLLTVGVGEIWGQIPVAGDIVTFHNTNYDVSMAYENTQVNGKNWFCQTKTTNDADPKQQWVIEDAGNGSFYLKNIGTESYLYQQGVEGNNDVWSFGFTTETSEYQTPKGKYTITQTGENYLIHLNSKGANEYLGLNTNKAPYNVIFADKKTDNGDLEWQIGLPAPTIAIDGTSCSISCPNTTATIYYTTDGTDPTTSGTRQTYSSPFELTEFTIVKACADKDGYVSSSCVSKITTGFSFLMQSVYSEYFFMTSLASSETEGNRVTTTNIPGVDISWHLVDAGIENDYQYYYFVNDAEGKYLAYTNSKIVVQTSTTFAEAADPSIYKFRIAESSAGDYNIFPYGNTNCLYQNKGNNNNNAIELNNNTTNTNNRWNFIARPASPKTLFDDSFASSDHCKQYYKVVSRKEATLYYLTPTATASATTDGDNLVWYIIPADDEDTYTLYYYIRNAATGQYLYSISKAGEWDKFFVGPSPSDDTYKFVIAHATKENDYHQYNIVPKALKGELNQIGISLNRNGTRLLTWNSRGDDGSRWVFEEASFTCATPTITYDAINGKVSMACTTADAKIYYKGYADEASYTADTPTLTSGVESFTLYEGTFTPSQPYYKAIATRCITNGNDQSEVAGIGPISTDFKCVTPVITFDSSASTITITTLTDGATIYYTLDADIDAENPTIGTTLYSAPFVLDGTHVVRAIAVKGDTSTASNVAIWDEAPHFVDRASEINTQGMGLNYVLNEGFSADATIGTELDPFTGTIDGGFHQISLSKPLVSYASSATIKNVIVSSSTISSGDTNGDAGAIVCSATGATRIYNCGVLSGSVSGSHYVGSIVGLLDGTSRVINCFSYADVSGGSDGGGIVGYNNYASTNTDIKTMVMNCIYYGNVSGSTNISPIYGGYNAFLLTLPESLANRTAVGRDGWT